MNLKYYIGYSTDETIRYRSSSGGIGSAIIKYLLETGMFGTSITFVFNKEECLYAPMFIYDYKDYNNCGSIYQDINTVSFIKNNLDKIKNGVVVTCMPCQVRPIRSLLERNNIKNFIISLCCSGQTTVQGTWCYYKFLHINKKHIVGMQYRGNGWPSGIQIMLDDGSIIKYANWTYPWTLIHSSLLYRPNRCVGCKFKTVPDSDINLADPWLKEYEDNDKIGNSVVIVNTEEGLLVLKKILEQGEAVLKEVDESTYILSQKGTIENKKLKSQNCRFNKLTKRLSNSKAYVKIVSLSPFLMKIHVKGISILKRFLL